MSNLHASPVASPKHASATEQPPASALVPLATPLPVLRTPMLDRERNLFAYEIVFHCEPGDEQNLLRSVLSTITEGALTRLVGGNSAFFNLSAELLLEVSDVLMTQQRHGLCVLT